MDSSGASSSSSNTSRAASRCPICLEAAKGFQLTAENVPENMFELTESDRDAAKGKKARILMWDRHGERLPRHDNCVVILSCCEATEPCPAVHATCLARHLVAEAERPVASLIGMGHGVPTTCPSCRRALSPSEVKRAFCGNSELLSQWLRASKAMAEAREAVQTARPEDAKLTQSLMTLGLRRCPHCAAWIEKAAGWFSGCDKMTCRCGTQFCYKCTRTAGLCNCTEAGHIFIPQEEVISNYPSFPFWFDRWFADRSILPDVANQLTPSDELGEAKTLHSRIAVSQSDSPPTSTSDFL